MWRISGYHCAVHLVLSYEISVLVNTLIFTNIQTLEEHESPPYVHSYLKCEHIPSHYWEAESPGLPNTTREGLTLDTGNRIEILYLFNLKC